jgi:glycosyltransferase involved in cell wall biosynthesis
MRVMFDVSTLGVGHAIPLYRSGIFRYSREIAAGLATSDEVQLELCSGLAGSTSLERFGNLEASLAYQKSDEALKTVDFPHNRMMRSLINAAQDIGIRGDNLFLKILKACPGAGVLEHCLTPLNRNSLDRAEIFHSPYFGLPEVTASVSGLRRFLTVHDVLPLIYPQFFEHGEEHAFKAIVGSVRPTDWVLCNSENTRNDLCEYFPKLDRSRMCVTLLAADPDLFYLCCDQEKLAAVRKRYSLPEGPYVLSVCTIEPRKNLDHLVRGFAELVRQQRIDDLNLVLVGHTGWKNQPVFNQIMDSGDVRRRIILTGYVSDEDMAAVYSGAMMFVFPSLYEGFGLPVLEAMQCGVPVIASNTSSLPEVVGDTGILIDPRDRAHLCSSMLKVYQSPSLRTTLSAASLARAREFSWPRCVKQTIDVYRLALAS